MSYDDNEYKPPEMQEILAVMAAEMLESGLFPGSGTTQRSRSKSERAKRDARRKMAKASRRRNRK